MARRKPSTVSDLVSQVKAAMQGSDLNLVQELTQSFYGTNKKEICLCIPSYKTICPVTMVALLATALSYGKGRIGLHFEFGDAVIENARNKIADKALADGYEWLMWIDDDIIPPFGRPDLTKRWTGVHESYQEDAGIEYLSRLMSHGKTLVGGLYFGRNAQGRPMYAEACLSDSYSENAKARNPNVASLEETQWVATGCMLSHRSVFEDIQKAYPELAPKTISYEAMDGQKVTRKQEVWDYFRKFEGCGEDVSFCFRARKAGHKVYLDHAVKCLHAGGNAWGYHNTFGGV
jgi:hypothetical protein